jgi:hypothetical protein
VPSPNGIRDGAHDRSKMFSAMASRSMAMLIALRMSGLASAGLSKLSEMMAVRRLVGLWTSWSPSSTSSSEFGYGLLTWMASTWSLWRAASRALSSVIVIISTRWGSCSSASVSQ